MAAHWLLLFQKLIEIGPAQIGIDCGYNPQGHKTYLSYVDESEWIPPSQAQGCTNAQRTRYMREGFCSLLRDSVKIQHLSINTEVISVFRFMEKCLGYASPYPYT
jgi:hypothetical protein